MGEADGEDSLCLQTTRMKVLSVASARPNFVKLAAVHHAFQEAALPGWEHLIVHTGQHYDPMFSDIFFQELGIAEPEKNLEVKSGESNEDTVERTRKAALPVLKTLKPDLILVYGDVSGALGGAQAARELKIPVAHIEAGLRSGDKTMPEERNRIAIDHIASLLFVTEQAGMDNLQQEGITENVHLVGNTMIDTLKRMGRAILKSPYPLPPHPEYFGLVTLHRPNNVDVKEALESNIGFLNQVASVCPIIFPVHRRTEASLKRFGLKQRVSPRIDIREPLGYLDFLKLLYVSDFILTDSGGIQEETTYLGVKCFTLRKNTERPCTLEKNGGTNTLIDSDGKRKIVLEFAKNRPDYTRRVGEALYSCPKEWQENASTNIIKVLKHYESSR